MAIKSHPNLQKPLTKLTFLSLSIIRHLYIDDLLHKRRLILKQPTQTHIAANTLNFIQSKSVLIPRRRPSYTLKDCVYVKTSRDIHMHIGGVYTVGTRI